MMFQLTAARRRLALDIKAGSMSKPFQLTAARRRLVQALAQESCNNAVSTHSRPKAAGHSA